MTLLFLSDFLPDDSLEFSSSFIQLITAADKVVFNLEGSPQVPRHESNNASQIMPFNVDTVIHFIKEFGKEKFLVALANNHILDNGVSGFDYLVEQFEVEGINYFGTREKPYILLSGVAILNLVTGETVAKKSEGETKLNYLFYDTREINQQIKSLESQSNKLIFYPHWGRDMDTTVFKTFAKKIKFRKKWIVFGHHTHVITGIEKDNIYSLGNTYIPHPYYFDTYPATHYGLAPLLDSDSMDYHLYYTEIKQTDSKYEIVASTFNGILPDAIEHHGKDFSAMKRLFLNLMAFRGNIIDVVKLRSLQTLRSAFALKYKLFNKQSR